MRKSLKNVIVVSFVFLSMSCSFEIDDRPNILFIMSVIFNLLLSYKKERGSQNPLLFLAY